MPEYEERTEYVPVEAPEGDAHIFRADTGTVVADPGELSPQQQRDAIKRLAIVRCVEFSKHRTTVTARDVLTMMRYAISKSTAYKRLGELEERDSRFSPKEGSRTLLFDMRG